MAYSPIRNPSDVAGRLRPGLTREDDWMEFKVEPYKPQQDGDECARDIAQFSNASGGTLILGAQEEEHLLQSFHSVPEPEKVVQWINTVLNNQLTPVPAVESQIIVEQGGATLVILNIMPAPVLIARRCRHPEQYEFPIRAGATRRYMALLEVEARMENKERLMRLRLEQIGHAEQVGLDAEQLRDVNPDEWQLASVDEHVVTLRKHGLLISIPLGYVEAVYRANEPGALWRVALSCMIQKVEGYLRVRKYNR